MNSNEKSNYCCCQLFPILNSLFYMSIHLLLHGTYGIYLVSSSFYKFKNPSMNYWALSASSFFVVVGLFIFGTSLKRSWRMAGYGSCLLGFVTAMNLVAFTIYFVRYIRFEANSLLDSILFWRSQGDWINRGDLPFTLWHVFTFFFVAFTLVGFYYCTVLSKYAKILRVNQTEAENRQNAVGDANGLFQGRVN